MEVIARPVAMGMPRARRARMGGGGLRE